MSKEVNDVVRSITEVLDNVEAVRGQEFANVVRLMSNIESMARLAVLHGAPRETVAMGCVAMLSMVTRLARFDDKQIREAQELVDTVHSQMVCRD